MSEFQTRAARALTLVAVFVSILTLAPRAGAAATQIELLNGTATDTTDTYAVLDYNGPTNLTSGGFSAGRAFAKIKLLDKPSDKAVELQVCFWRNNLVQETCSGFRRTSKAGVVWMDLGSLDRWWSKNGTWTWDKGVQLARVMIKDADTRQLLKSRRCGSACYKGSDLDEHVPITLQAQMIVVAEGEQLDPPSNWGNCPKTFGNQCTGSPDLAGFGVEAGDPITVTEDRDVKLVGKVYGDEPETAGWQKLSGPGSIRWTNRGTTTPTASFREPGTYKLRFSATDSYGKKEYDDLTVTVKKADGTSPPTTAAPTTTAPTTSTPTTTAPSGGGDGTTDGGGAFAADAGRAFTTTMGERVSLAGSTSGASGKVSIRWWKNSGPGSMAWSTKTSTDPIVKFTSAGTYVLTMQASSGGTVVKDQIAITVEDDAAPTAPPTTTTPTTTTPPTTTPTTAPSGGGDSGDFTLDLRPTEVRESNNGTSTLVFRVVLSKSHSKDVTVDFSTTGLTATTGVDYQERNVEVVIPAGETKGYVGVVVYGDRAKEPDEKLRARISDASAGSIGDATAVGLIRDND